MPSLRPTRPRLVLLGLAIVLVVVDLIAKYAAERALSDGNTIDLGVIQLRLTFNTGVAFSFGAGLPSWVILTATGVITLGIAVFAWWTAPTTPLIGRIGLAAILAGAVGNLVDRAADGAVTDFFYTGWFATFNLADALLSVGLALLILSMFVPHHESTPDEVAEDDRTR